MEEEQLHVTETRVVQQKRLLVQIRVPIRVVIHASLHVEQYLRQISVQKQDIVQRNVR